MSNLKAVKTPARTGRLLSELTPDELKDHLVRDLGKWVAKNSQHIKRARLPMFLFASGKEEFIIQPIGEPKAIISEMAATLIFTEVENASILANAVNTYWKLREKYKSEKMTESQEPRTKNQDKKKGGKP